MTKQEYVKAIDKLADVAEVYANNCISKKDFNNKEHDLWAAEWNKTYHTEVNRLAFEAGLRNLPISQLA